VKVLPPEFLHQSASLDRFKQEASIVARLEHRAIVPVHDYGEYEGIPYIVMRYMDGGSVEDLLADGLLAPEQVLHILQQIAPALDYAHREGVLHRDLKPSNILLDANGDAFITDFGIARILGVNKKPLTTSGVVGTPSYMSPEQAQGHELDGRSDVYALGVVLFEMLTGVRPFDGETPYSVAVKHVTEAPPSACAMNPDLPRVVEPVLHKALEKKPDARYQTAAEVTTALAAALESPGDADLNDADDTHPTLNEMLKAEAAYPVLPQAVPRAQLYRASPDIQIMPAYVSPASRSYAGPLVPPRHRRRAGGLPSWLTWATVGMLIGGLLLAAVLVGGYYLLNSSNGGAGTTLTEDLGATASFKLTATGEVVGAPVEEADSAAPGEIAATSPPTNTPRAAPDGPS
jgi:serine/threonine-protein kinase